jgi:hypothetical protein
MIWFFIGVAVGSMLMFLVCGVLLTTIVFKDIDEETFRIETTPRETIIHFQPRWEYKKTETSTESETSIETTTTYGDGV